ncbi:hypothetical protein WME91_52525 [Sorangium sp. So ce269]
MHGLDATYRELLARMPVSAREVAVTLPYRLGLTGAPDVGWDALVLLELNREPALFAAEDPAAPGASLVSEEVLSAYREAHHCCAILWMTSDAVADVATTGTPMLPRLRRTLVRSWLAALTRATGDPDVARREVRSTLATIREARAEERRVYMRGPLSPSVYAALVQRKIAWCSCAARCLLQRAGAPARLDAFRDIYDSWLFALQCRDDVEDAAEDAGTYRTTVADALRISPAALLAAGPRVVETAVARAHAHGFRRLAGYLERWLSVVRPWLGEPLSPEVDREAAALAAAWEKRARPG